MLLTYSLQRLQVQLNDVNSEIFYLNIKSIYFVMWLRCFEFGVSKVIWAFICGKYFIHKRWIQTVCKFLSQGIVNFSYEKLLFHSLLKVVQKLIHNHHELFSLLFHESGLSGFYFSYYKTSK